MDEELEDTKQQEGSSQANSLNTSFGPVAASLFLSNTNGTSREMLLRFSSWLIAAINWPDSKICAKAAQLLVKIIDYVSVSSLNLTCICLNVVKLDFTFCRPFAGPLQTLPSLYRLILQANY